MDHSFHFPGHRGVTGQIWRETLMKADPRLGYYFPCSHVSCHKTHTTQSAKLTLPGALRRSKIVDIYDNMRDRHLVWWCLSGNVPDDKLRITRMGDSSDRLSRGAGWQWMFSTNRSPLSPDSEPTSWDSWTLSSSLVQVHISWYFTRLEN